MRNYNIIKKWFTVALSAAIGFTILATSHVGTAAAATASQANSIINIGDNYLGVPYRFGAPSGVTRVFDCSSFTQYVFKKAAGISLPRTSKAQSKVGSYVARSNLKKGDLVFFRTTGKGVNHVAIYAGNNRILHTYGKGGVRFSSLSESHWNSHYLTARRVS